MSRILVIDDQSAMRLALRRILEREGHQVQDEPDGHVALRRYSGDPADLVITDVFMPNMDGIDFVLRMKGAFPDSRVIVMSGGSLLPKEEVLTDAFALGADATLAKPFDPGELIEVVNRVLSTPPPTKASVDPRDDDPESR